MAPRGYRAPIRLSLTGRCRFWRRPVSPMIPRCSATRFPTFSRTPRRRRAGVAKSPCAGRLDAIRRLRDVPLRRADSLAPAGHGDFRAEFEAAWTHGGHWIPVWHPFLSGRLSRCMAIDGLIERCAKKATSGSRRSAKSPHICARSWRRAPGLRPSKRFLSIERPEILIIADAQRPPSKRRRPRWATQPRHRFAPYSRATA